MNYETDFEIEEIKEYGSGTIVLVTDGSKIQRFVVVLTPKKTTVIENGNDVEINPDEFVDEAERMVEHHYRVNTDDVPAYPSEL